MLQCRIRSEKYSGSISLYRLYALSMALFRGILRNLAHPSPLRHVGMS